MMLEAAEVLIDPVNAVTAIYWLDVAIFTAVLSAIAYTAVYETDRFCNIICYY
jgi:hypothetical protein